jgi:hypothetical protein
MENLRLLRASGTETIAIGKPAVPPSSVALEAMRSAIASTKATRVFWFWVSINNDPPHLGLAVSPDDPEVFSQVARGVGPIWSIYSPQNSLLDILGLGRPNSDPIILKEGSLLFDVSPRSKLQETLPEMLIVVLSKPLDPNGQTISLQDFVVNGESIIPLFTSEAPFRQSTGGVDLGRPVMAISRDLLASLLHGNEVFLLDPQLPSERRFTAADLKN